MSRFFNIAGPCNPKKHYMLSPMERLPEVRTLIERGQCFVVHAQRQCGKTTAFIALMQELNQGNTIMALYCSLEVLQAFADMRTGIPMICEKIKGAARMDGALAGCPALNTVYSEHADLAVLASGISDLLSALAAYANKKLVVFFDEVDCLSGETLITFLRQLRDGYVASQVGHRAFPVSIGLIGMRNIRDFKARLRPDSESLGSASPFNVIAEALNLRTFTEQELRELYAQHTAETGQVFEDGALRLAWEYSFGQPYLVNALARWCVEKIHGNDAAAPITAEDMHEAKEKLIRERGTHLDSLMERIKEPRVRPIIENLMLGNELAADSCSDDLSLVMDLGLIREENGVLKPANPIYAEVMGRYLTWETQRQILAGQASFPWIHDNGLDMGGFMMAFQQFWRENADGAAVPFEYHEAYPQLVLQAFLQRVLNGGGEIIREMALGKKAMDLGIRFKGQVYAVECKKRAFYEKSRDKAYDQVWGYMDRLGVSEGWLVVFDSDLTRQWDEKIASEDVPWREKTIHLICC